MAWHLIAHACELANPGDFVCLPIGPGKEIAATRLDDGGLMVFDNRCPHRGARIFTEMFGNRPPVCAYHGRCVRQRDATVLPLARVGDWFIVNDTPGSDEPEPIWSHVLPRGKTAPALTRHSVLTFVQACHWTVAVENALDFEHVRTVHAASLHPLNLIPGAQAYHGGGSSEEQFASDSARLATLRRMFPEAHPQAPDYRHIFMFPYTALSSTAGAHYSLQHYFPRADGMTEFVHRLYLTPTAWPQAGDSIAAFNRQVFDEDAAVCKLVAPWHKGLAEPRIEYFREHAVTHEVMR